MPYRIKRREKVRKAVRRVIREQLDRAIGEGRDRHLPLDERVHQLRARLKRARAVLRLVRAQTGRRARRDERWMRDAARLLARSRDLTVEADTLRGLVRGLAGELPRAGEALARIEERVAEQRASRRIEGQLGTAIATLRRRRGRAGGGRLDHGRRALRGGLEAAYRRARRARRAVRDDDDAERFHDWRKAVKRLGCQLRLLRKAVPDLWGTLGEPLARLGDLLGQAHDLASLRARVAAEPRLFGDARDRAALVAAIDRRSAVLHDEARALGAEALSARPREIGARADRAWVAWRQRRAPAL